ncbi:MAG: sulfotransferase [Alphaproteobacteria bacterium]|nr:sulfotransferase [Alphaproteobacteria bacterium]
MTGAAPVFVLCPARSFSSVVSCCLGEHPALYGLPEMYLFVADTVGELIGKAARRGPFMLHGLLRVLAELREGGQSEAGVEAARAWLAARPDMGTAALYHEVAEMVAPRACVDKTPSYAFPRNLRRLIAAWPDARFLHLGRHPRPTGISLRNARSKGLRTIDAAEIERYWHRTHADLAEFGAGLPPGRYMYLRGEAFLAEPRLWLGQIAEWLGISGAPEAIEAMCHPETSSYARPGPANAPYGHNPGFLEDPRLRIGAPPPASLAGPLDWMPDGDGFAANTIGLARRLGYR